MLSRFCLDQCMSQYACILFLVFSAKCLIVKPDLDPELQTSCTMSTNRCISTAQPNFLTTPSVAFLCSILVMSYLCALNMQLKRSASPIMATTSVFPHVMLSGLYFPTLPFHWNRIIMRKITSLDRRSRARRPSLPHSPVPRKRAKRRRTKERSPRNQSLKPPQVESSYPQPILRCTQPPNSCTAHWFYMSTMWLYTNHKPLCAICDWRSINPKSCTHSKLKDESRFNDHSYKLSND